MKARHALHSAGAVVLPGVLLLGSAACVGEGLSGSASTTPTDAVAPTETAARVSDARKPGDTAPCRAGPSRSWAVGEVATRRLVARGEIKDVGVDRTGTATVAWTNYAGDGTVQTADEPAAPGEPQSPAGPPDPQRRALFDAFGEDALGVEAAGAQTLLWLSDERGPGAGPSPFTEDFEVVIADRSAGAGWSSPPAVVGAGYVHGARLAVNASGAAVATWTQFEGPNPRVYASYRNTDGSEWTPVELVARNAGSRRAGIDDKGRVLLLFTRGSNERERTYAVRRTPAGEWGQPQRLPGKDSGADLAVGADGSAVVLRSRVSYGAEAPRGSQVTLRMTPSGRWESPVRQPDFTGDSGWGSRVDVDAKGRALLAWWRGPDLLIRRSRSGGEWRRPCVVAANIKQPRSIVLDARVAVNRRGDALVVWGARNRVAQLWVRYKPAGRGWTKPVNVTRSDSPPDSYTVELGDGGHAAVAWMPRNGRQIHVVRTSPRP